MLPLPGFFETGISMPSALELLKTRTSPKAADLVPPAPSEAQLAEILTVAARVPDHGMMKPWRFIVLPRETRGPLVEKLTANFRSGNPNASDAEVDKQRLRFGGSPLIVTVVSKVSPNPKVPDIEQLLSAGAACMNLLNAAHAMGFGANWLTGWAAFDKSSKELFGLADNEQIVGFVHIGTVKGEIFQRPRPDMAQIVSRR
ncbi:MAG: nitroreductase [Xanthobacteraceae bacterium]|nr:nitroreductase [Xanthobacteraceae bacterium]